MRWVPIFCLWIASVAFGACLGMMFRENSERQCQAGLDSTTQAIALQHDAIAKQTAAMEAADKAMAAQGSALQRQGAVLETAMETVRAQARYINRARLPNPLLIPTPKPGQCLSWRIRPCGTTTSLYGIGPALGDKP